MPDVCPPFAGTYKSRVVSSVPEMYGSQFRGGEVGVVVDGDIAERTGKFW